MEILKAEEHHIPAIIALAHKTWHETYDRLVPEGQVQYMIDTIYQPDLLLEQFNNPAHHVYVLIEDQEILGYAHCIEQEQSMKLSKLYVRTHLQKKGVGTALLEFVESQLPHWGSRTLELCVNRGNPAQFFYEKMGFQIVKEVDIPFGPYWMNDYLMRKQVDEK